MLRESVSYVIARNETWTGANTTEPVEAGWASEAVFFVRALRAPKGNMPPICVEISPDGMRWASEGTTTTLPDAEDGIAVLRVNHFGNWLRLSTTLAEGAECVVLVTVHLK